eukprot:m.24766 g.24766  ORF g.24766 m.24766 type:complete len:183 (+) comp9128_c2_seq2:225-773(+)
MIQFPQLLHRKKKSRAISVSPKHKNERSGVTKNVAVVDRQSVRAHYSLRVRVEDGALCGGDLLEVLYRNVANPLTLTQKYGNIDTSSLEVVSDHRYDVSDKFVMDPHPSLTQQQRTMQRVLQNTGKHNKTKQPQQQQQQQQSDDKSQFLTKYQKQRSRVQRIRRAIQAATVIQRAWRRYKQQ